jgi:pimeloyl-ACP methyl ester carboxylesterase
VDRQQPQPGIGYLARCHARQHHALLADGNRRLVGEAVCGKLPIHATRQVLDIPVGVSLFAGDTFLPPRIWGERTYSKLFYWNRVPRGGHFAAFEQPALFTSELRTCFAGIRT